MTRLVNLIQSHLEIHLRGILHDAFRAACLL